MALVCMLYVGAMAASSYLSLYADKILKGENQSIWELDIVLVFLWVLAIVLVFLWVLIVQQ